MHFGRAPTAAAMFLASRAYERLASAPALSATPAALPDSI